MAAYHTIGTHSHAAGAVAGVALTKTDDTNITLTLGGTPASALLVATSLTLGWAGQLSIARGGTGQATKAAAFDALSPMSALGDVIYGGIAGTGARLAATVPAANVRNVFGLDNLDTVPAWKPALDGTAPVTQAFGDVAAAGTSLIFAHRDHAHGMPALANPTASIGLSIVNGLAATAMRSDGAPALNQSIAPTWTGVHLASAAYRNSAYGSFLGVTTAPPNTTAGDLSAIRLILNGLNNGITIGTTTPFGGGMYVLRNDSGYQYQMERTTAPSGKFGFGVEGSGNFFIDDVNGAIRAFTIQGQNAALGPLSALATTATHGFFCIGVMNGTPTGAPVVPGGSLPMVFDYSANKLWIRDAVGTWRFVALT